MPRRRGSSWGNSSASTKSGTSAGAWRNTHSRQQPARYSHPAVQDLPLAISEDSKTVQSNTEIIDASYLEYPETSPMDSPISHESPPYTSTIFSSSPASRSPSEQNTRQNTASFSNLSIRLHYMRILLQSHEQEIVDRVVLCLSSNSNVPHPQNYIAPQAPDLRAHQLPQTQQSQTQIMELES